MIVDAHVHIGTDKDGASQTMDRQIKAMRECGIDKSVVFPFNENVDLVEASIALLKYKSSSIIPFLRFDPKRVNPESVEELLSGQDFAGVKLHPRAQNFDPVDRRYYPIYKKIEDSGKPLLLHSRKMLPFMNRPGRTNPAFSDPDRMVRLAREFPNLNIILAHFANMSKKALSAVGKHENLFIETSIFGTVFTVKIFCEKIGAEKIIYGSDSPYSDQEIEVLKIKKADIGRKEKELILGRNILSLIKT